MIERGHIHKMVPVGTLSTDGGDVLQVEYRCETRQPSPSDPFPCAMHEQRRFRVSDGLCIEVRVRLHGIWFHPYDLIRSLPLDTRECQMCFGEPLPSPCERCAGLGLETPDGDPIRAPELHVHA